MAYFTVITTCFNSSRTIKDTLESILNQSFKDYEYIIYDAGSTDGTVDILEAYRPKFNGRMRYVSESDEGIYDGMNKGVRNASGKYVSILNSDDFYHKEALRRVYDVVKVYKEEDGLPILFGDVCRVKQNKEPVYRYHFNYGRIEKNIPFGHPSMFVPKFVYDREGEYDYKRFKLAADLDFQYRLYEHKGDYKWIVIDHIITYMREGGATDNLNNLLRWSKEIADLDVEYNGKSRLNARLTAFVGRVGRSIKNKLPYPMQKVMYRAYRRDGNDYPS